MNKRKSKDLNSTPKLSTISGTCGEQPRIKRVPAIFYKTQAGGEPVREWLRSREKEDRRTIGMDLNDLEFAWPVGMPLARELGGGLHECRSRLSGNRIARVFFYIDVRGKMVLLHGFIKKTRTTPVTELALAKKNKSAHERSLNAEE